MVRGKKKLLNRPMPFLEVTYADGSVEEIEADDCRELGRHLTFVNYRIPFVTTVYTEIVRRLDHRAVVRVDKGEPIDAHRNSSRERACGLWKPTRWHSEASSVPDQRPVRSPS